jgi:hypothetical protein
MRDFGWVCCRSSGFPEAGLNWCQKTESCNYARQVTPDGGRQASQRTRRQQHARAHRQRFGETHESTAVLMSARRVFMRNRMALVRLRSCAERRRHR